MNYAGFWLRFVAFIVDAIILGIFKWFVVTPILAAIGIATSLSFSDFENPDDIALLVFTIIGIIWISILVGAIINLLYHSFMDASKYQGSIGKQVIGLKVIDTTGERLDIGKALLRNFCKWISSAFFFIGYIIAGFTDKKQALHDLIAGTLVIKKSA